MTAEGLRGREASSAVDEATIMSGSGATAAARIWAGLGPDRYPIATTVSRGRAGGKSLGPGGGRSRGVLDFALVRARRCRLDGEPVRVYHSRQSG